MYHGRFSALTGEGIHIAWPDPDFGDLFLGAPADTFHICAQKRIDTGDADHDHSGTFSLFFQSPAEFRDRRRDFFQMPSRDQIGLVHGQVKKAILIARHTADGGSVSAAASRGDDQHDRTGNSQTCTLDTIPFCARRVESERRG